MKSYTKRVIYFLARKHAREYRLRAGKETFKNQKCYRVSELHTGSTRTG